MGEGTPSSDLSYLSLATSLKVDVLMLSSRYLACKVSSSWIKLPGLVNTVASPHLFGVVIPSRFPIVTGTDGTPLRDVRTSVLSSIQRGVQVDFYKSSTQNFLSPPWSAHFLPRCVLISFRCNTFHKSRHICFGSNSFTPVLVGFKKRERKSIA